MTKPATAVLGITDKKRNLRYVFFWLERDLNRLVEAPDLASVAGDMTTMAAEAICGEDDPDPVANLGPVLVEWQFVDRKGKKHGDTSASLDEGGPEDLYLSAKDCVYVSLAQLSLAFATHC